MLLAAALGLRLWVALATPVLFAPDEVGHVNYLREVALNGRFPVAPVDRQWGIDFGVHEFFQPPLFYVLAAPVYSLFAPAGPVAVLAVRVVDTVLGTALVAVCYAVAAAVVAGRRGPALVGAAAIAFLPTAVGNSATVSNDTLANLVVGLGAWVLVRRPVPSLPIAAAVGALAGLAIDIKLSGLLLVVGVGVWAAGAPASAARRVALLAAAAGPAAILAAPWIVFRNLACYRDPLAVNFDIPPTAWSVADAVVFNVLYLPATLWAAFGRLYEIRPFPVVGLAMFAGLVWLVVAVGRRLDGRGPLPVLLAMLAVNAASILADGMRFAGEAQGRYLLASAASLAALVAVGAVHLSPRLCTLAVLGWAVVAVLVVGALALPRSAHPSVLEAPGQGIDRPFTAPDFEHWVAHRSAPIEPGPPACRL